MHQRTDGQPRAKHLMGIQFLPFLHYFRSRFQSLVLLFPPPSFRQTMEVDMLLNMDGFDDNTTSVFYGANSWGTAFATGPTGAFSPGASGGSVAGNLTRSNLHPTDQTTSSASDPSRSSMSNRPLARSSEDVPWQMYLSPSLSDSLYSLDILDPNSVGLVYPQHDLASFTELDTTLETPRLSGYQDTQTVNDVQQMFCDAPLVAPQPRIIQPALLSLISTQDSENSLLLAQGESSTKSDEHTEYTSSISDVGVLSAPQFDTYLTQSAPSSSLLSSSRGRDPTITKLVNNSPTSTRPRRGLSGWGNTTHLEPPAVPSSTVHHHHHHQKPPSSTSSSKSLNSSLMVPPHSLSPSLSSGTRGSSRNSERLLKRLRQSDEESLPILKQASKTRRIMVAADVDTEEDSVDNNNNNDDDDDDGDEDSDSDDYMPSRSPSLIPSRSISPSSQSFVFKSETGVTPTSVKKKPKKGKGKAKGSAALALAVVSQMVRNPSAAGRRDIDLISARYATGIKRRKNQPIPLPIPVPNLNKKSRGRKVPHVATTTTTTNDTVTKKKSSKKALLVKQEEDAEGDDDDDEIDELDEESGGDEEDQKSRSSSTRSRKQKPNTPEMSKTPSGENRTFVCVVPGCGKCFVRSEHLKRHVRSIHTHDKRELFFPPLPPFFFLCSVKNNRSSR